MEQVSPDNHRPPDDQMAEDRPEVVDLTPVPEPAVVLEEPNREFTDPMVSEGAEVWPTEPTLADPSIEVVDPYTAAPPALGFDESFAPPIEETPVADDVWTDQLSPQDPFVPIPYVSSTQSETIRNSGLAWSAGVAFFGSVAFTLFLGWLADLLLGSFPWGIVGGIVLGSIIGFLQFFRITSRIFPRKNDGPEINPLMSRRDDE